MTDRTVHVTSTDGTPLCVSCAFWYYYQGCTVKDTGTAFIVTSCDMYYKKEVAK